MSDENYEPKGTSVQHDCTKNGKTGPWICVRDIYGMYLKLNKQKGTKKMNTTVNVCRFIQRTSSYQPPNRSCDAV